MNEPIETTARMSYESYAYIKSLLDKQIENLEKEFQIACNYVSSEYYTDGSNGHDRAYKVFQKEFQRLKRMKNELADAVKSQYKDHPKQEMRQFWGIES